jgi:transcriptional regulator with XRE-family HTH domain
MPKETGLTDRLVGNRIRMRREALGMSQSALGRAIGVSFQQVQKYEQGKNRIGASRLTAIASHLGVTVASLFDEMPTGGAEPDDVIAALRERGAVDLVRAYGSIRDSHLRQQMLDLVQSVARLSAKPAA